MFIFAGQKNILLHISVNIAGMGNKTDKLMKMYGQYNKYFGVMCSCKKKTKMRIPLIIIILFLSFQSNGQNNDSIKRIVDCELLTTNKLNQITEILSKEQFEISDVIIDELIKQCGVSEFIQRLIILRNIIEKKSTNASILKYFENDMHYVYRDRIQDSKKINFGYVYSNRKAYYGYIPLRHEIDSIIINKAVTLLETDSLNLDERLICIIFTGQFELFEKEIEKRQYKQSCIKQYLKKDYREYRKNFPYFTIYTGIFRPLNSNDIFTYSPMFGFTICNPMIDKYTIEFGFKFRRNIHDDSFDYFALEKNNQVNSKYSLFFGGLVGYKVIESEKLILTPKFGLGFETVDTGISEKKRNSAEETSYNLETANFTVGISAMTPVFRRSYLGIGINYHFCPYNLDKNLLTKIESNLMSIEIFWRF